MRPLALQATALVAAITFFLPAHAVDSCNQHGGNLDQHTRTTIPGTECGDEGYFSGWGTLMMLWPHDDRNIVRRHAPDIDTDGDGTADGKDPVGYPHLVNRIYLEQDWRDANGSAGFPLNLKSETSFDAFITHLEGKGYGRQCVFDVNGCVDSSSNVQTDPAIPAGEECPDSFYAGNVCAPQTCTGWSTGAWSPARSTVCSGATFNQTRTVTEAPSGCAGTPPGNRPGSSRSATGTKTTASCSTNPPRSCARWSTGAWSPATSSRCRGVTFTQRRTVSRIPAGCAGTPPGSRPSSSRSAVGTSISAICATPPPPPPPCTATAWSPPTSSRCRGVTFTQSRTACPGTITQTRPATGTSTIGNCAPCTATAWSPSTTSRCSGVSFTQSRTRCPGNIRETRPATGTSSTGSCAPCTATSWSPSTGSRCSGVSFTQSRTRCPGNIRETQAATGTSTTGSCAPTPTCPPGQILWGNVCADRCAIFPDPQVCHGRLR